MSTRSAQVPRPGKQLRHTKAVNPDTGPPTAQRTATGSRVVGAAEPAVPGRRLRATGPAAAAALGMTVLIAGTFLPWVVSGQVRRNIYEIAGLIQRLDVLSGTPAVLVHALPFLGPACIVPVLVGVLGWRRSAGVLSVVLGLLLGGGSMAILALLSGRSAMGVALDPIGPTMTTVGAVLVTAAGVFFMLPARRAGHDSGGSKMR